MGPLKITVVEMLGMLKIVISEKKYGKGLAGNTLVNSTVKHKSIKSL